MTDLSRRHLIQGAVAAGAALAGSTVAVASPKQKWDEVVDVVVIGSGFAGLAAAIEAKKAGANVVVLEKMATFGGNSIINGGILTATGCPQQKLHKIEDSVELLEKDILTAGNYMNYSSKVRYLAEHALSNYEWTVKELGVQYLPDAIGQEGGHSVPRYVTARVRASLRRNSTSARNSAFRCATACSSNTSSAVTTASRAFRSAKATASRRPTLAR